MSSTPGPVPEDEADEDEQSGVSLHDLETLLDVLETQAGGLQQAVMSVKEDAEPGEELSVSQVESVRTEVIEFQALVENHLPQHCSETTPWEYAGEHVPESHLEDFVSKA